MKPEHSKKRDPFADSAFEIEHALCMYARSFFTVPADQIYDRNLLLPHAKLIDSCHIYLIGYTPKVDFVEAKQEGRLLLLTFEVQCAIHVVSFELPEGWVLRRDEDAYFLTDPSGRQFWPDADAVQRKLNFQSGVVDFEVKYVGQAFGKKRARNALDRLTKHETLQKIALKGSPPGFLITLLLLEIQPNNQLFSIINPFAKNSDTSDERILQGADKLVKTTEAERISLYEAALIRYFNPEFNSALKNSFPSTNLKILRDCYDKDICGVVAEICLDELPFRLWSKAISPKLNHIAKYDLHASDDRKLFFGL